MSPTCLFCGKPLVRPKAFWECPDHRRAWYPIQFPHQRMEPEPSGFCIHPVPLPQPDLGRTTKWCAKRLELIDGVLKCPVHGRNYMYDGVTPEKALELWGAKRDNL